MDESFKGWFDQNILDSYYYGNYPWTWLGYTYDWADNGKEYGLTEFLIKKGAQTERTAIERSFGMRKAQCRWSILSGFVLLVLLRSIIGSATGAKLSNQFSAENARETYYDMAYTVGTTNNANEIEVEEEGASSLPSVFCTILVVVAGTGIAWGK